MPYIEEKRRGEGESFWEKGKKKSLMTKCLCREETKEEPEFGEAIA